MNSGKRGSDRGSSQKGSDSRRSPAMHDRTSGKRSPASSHSPANKCGSIPPLLQNEMNRAAAASFLSNFPGAAAFPPAVWQDLPYLLNLNPLQPSFMPRLPLGLDMFTAPFLHPMPGSAPGLFPPGLPLLRPPGSTAGLLHSPFTALFNNVNDVPVHLLPKTDQTGSRPRSAKKTSSLASSSSESDIAARTGASNLSAKHDPKPSHSRKEFWHGPAEIAQVDMRKQRLSGSPLLAKSNADEVVDVLNYSDGNHDSPLELTVKKSNVVPATEVGPPKRTSSAVDEVTSHDDMISRAGLELHRVTSCEKYPLVPQEDDIECLSLRKTMSDASLNLTDEPTIFSSHSGHTGNFSDGVLEELKPDEDRRLLLETMNEARDLTKASCGTGTDFEVSQISGAAPARQNIALPPRKRLTRNPEELGLGVPNQSSGSDSPSSASNFRLYWKKFAAKTNLNGQPSHRAFISGGKPVHDCRTFFQKMAAKDACKSGLLIGKTFISGKGKGYFHRAVSRSSPRFSRTEGGIGAPPDGSTSPRVTRSQSKLKQKKSGGSPKSSPTEPPMPVRKSLRKKTANSKYETEDMIKMGGKGSSKKETPPKGGTKSLGKSAEKETGRSTKSGDLSDNMDDEDLKKQGKPYSLRDREEKAKERGSKGTTGKDGLLKPGDASSGLPQSMQPLQSGISKPAESCLETPERKKGLDDSFEEKGISTSSKHIEHDGKSMSSGVSTCSADVALDPEILSLPPKFRRAKGKTISTSQSVSSIEDDRCAEGMHKDIKVDLCRVHLDHDHSLHSGCGGKTQCLVNPAMKHSDTSVECSGKELRLETKSSKIHPDVAEAAEHEEHGQSGSLQEQKSSHKMPNLAEVERKVEADKKLEVEKNLETEKKSEIEKVAEPKADKPYRSTGGKKSLLYRSSLSAAFDERETTVASKTEIAVVPPGFTHGEPVSLSADMTPCRGKADESTTEIVQLHESNKTYQSEATSVTKGHERTASDESKALNREDLRDVKKLDSVEAPQPKSSLEFPGLHGSLHPSALRGPFLHGPVSQTDPAKGNTEKNSKALSAADDSDAPIVSKRQGTPVTRLGTELKMSDSTQDLSHQDIPTSGLAVEVKQKALVSQPMEVIASETKGCVPPRSEIPSLDPVQLSAILPTLVQCSDDNSTKFRRSLGEAPVRKAELLGGIQQRGVTERRTTSEAQRASKKRSLEDTLSIVRNKKLKKGEGLDQAGKVTADEAHQQISVQVYDAQEVSAKEQDAEVGGVPVGGKSLSINPLHFYSHRKSVPPSSSSGLSQTAPPIATTSHSDAGHSELTPIGSKKARGPPGDVSATKQGSRSGGRARPDISSGDPSGLDSEPPVLEKTDFTYMEQFSDISDSDEGEHRGPPMLEATSDCGVAKAKPCSGLALDKHILFAKIASSAIEKSGTSLGSRSEELGTSDVAKDVVPNCGPFANLTSPNGNTSHASFHHPISNLSTSPPVSNLPAPSSISVPLAPPPVSHSVLPSASSPSVNHSSSPPEHQSSASSSASRQRKSAIRQTKRTSKQAKQQSSSAAMERTTPSPSPAEFSSKDLPIGREGNRHGNSTLSADDLESCGIVAPSPSVTKAAVAKKKMLSKNRDAARLAASGVKKTSDLSSLLQHCKSFSVIVQKIDEKGRKRQHRNKPVLDPDISQGDPDPDVLAVYEATDAKYRTSSDGRKEAKSVDKKMTRPLSAKSTNRMTAIGHSTKLLGEKTTSRKQKPKATRKELRKLPEAKEKSGAKILNRMEKDEVKAETKEESMNLSIYDFDKDSNDEVDFETPLRKESSKKPRSLERVTKPRRPIRLKLHVAEHSPDPKSVTRGKLISDEKLELAALKEVQPSTPHSEKSLDSNEKLAVGPTDASIGHVKCRLVKVGRHQWMSVGDSNPQESSSRGGASDVRSASSAYDALDNDDSLPETKIAKVTVKALPKQLQSRNDGSMAVKASKSRAKSHVEPKKKRGRRATRASAAAEELAASENSIPSFSRGAGSSGALSPNSVMDQASRCSESESMAVHSSNSNDSKIPDFLDLLFGDDLEGFVLDEVSETRVPDTEAIVRGAIERANFSNTYDSELDDYHETLSPTSTFFVPSEIETQLAKMTLSDHPLDFIHDTNSTLLPPSKQLATTLHPEVRETLPAASLTPRSLAHDEFTPQDDKENHLEVDRLLTQTSTNSDDGEDSLRNQFGDDLMEEFVSWLSPKWDDTSLHDLEDPLNSLNLFSPFIDSPKTRQKLYV